MPVAQRSLVDTKNHQQQNDSSNGEEPHAAVEQLFALCDKCVKFENYKNQCQNSQRMRLTVQEARLCSKWYLSVGRIEGGRGENCQTAPADVVQCPGDRKQTHI